MSMQSWKNEFYPISASEAAEYFRNGDLSEHDVTEHSLRKWRGLRPENLAKHGIVRSTSAGSCIGDPSEKPGGVMLDWFGVDAGTCSLCQVYDPEEVYDEVSGDCVVECNDCPLFLSRGKVSCDSRMRGEERSPYWDFVTHGDPEPMIAALEKCL